MAFPASGPIPVGGVVSTWSLTPATNVPVASELRLNVNAPGQYAPASQTFPASGTSTFPLSKFLGISFSTTVTFTSPTTWTGTFTGTAQILVVAGGGGGGGNATIVQSPGGGGGGGGYIATTISITKGSSYPVTIGAGGAGGPSAGNRAGTKGNPTIFYTLTAEGGGYGGSGGPGGPGGCGGGHSSSPGPDKPSTTGSQGQPGGYWYSPQGYSSAGGGGSGTGGSNTRGDVPSYGGLGGAGYLWPVNSTYYCGGGSSIVFNQSFPLPGGVGGGGKNGYNPSNGGPGTYYGGGGGGCGNSPSATGGNGYQGIVIVTIP